VNAYEKRDRLLRALGYASYGQYLRSTTWENIRETVLRENNYCCVRCGRRATQVHHRHYSRAVLTGQNTRSLIAICYDCHTKAEREEDGSKRDIVEANHAIIGPKVRREKRKRPQGASPHKQGSPTIKEDRTKPPKPQKTERQRLLEKSEQLLRETQKRRARLMKKCPKCRGSVPNTQHGSIQGAKDAVSTGQAQRSARP